MSPDYNPLSNNGSKSSFRCREEGESGTKTILTTTNGIGGGFRFRSPSKPPSQENSNTNHYNTTNNNSTTTTASPLRDNNNHHLSSGRGGGGGDVLLQLQWGHKKRARLSRTEIRSLTVNDDSSSSSSFHRRAGAGSPFIDKPPPPPPHSHPSNATSTSTRPFNLRTKDSSGFINNRNTEDRSAAANGSGDSSRGVSRSAVVGKGSPHSSEKFDKKIRKDDKTTNGSTITRADSAATTTPVQSEQETRAGVVAAAAAGTSNTLVSVSFAEKVNVEVIEWPKIYVALSRKEKEDDFLAMKGTKLPHRPKKRAKNIDRTLQYCFPGMWLADLTKSRYEVREKKSVKKKKRRGLKGMESMESDSE